MNEAIISSSAANVNSLPPYTNRGVRQTHKFYDAVFSVDWLRITVWSEIKYIADLLEIYGVAGKLESTGYGGIGFRTIWQAPNGFQLYADPVSSDVPYVSINIPGKAIADIGLDAILEAHEWLCENGRDGLRWRCTRIDLAFDTLGFSVSDFERAYHEGNVETVARSWQSVQGSDGGHTFYLGSRQSQAFARVYHKMDGSSFGENVPFTRVELELKDVRAEMAIFEVLQAKFDDMPILAANILTGFVTVASEWWESFMIDVKAAWVKLHQAAPTVERIKNWLYEQVAASFVTFIGAVSYGDQAAINGEVNKLITQGKKRLQKRHYSMMRSYQADNSIQFAGGGW